MANLSAIILAAGKGTRMRSDKAKVMFPLAGKTMIERVVDSAEKLDCTCIYVVVGYQKEAVIAKLQDDKHLHFVEQKEQLGTGHAVMMAEPVFSDLEQDVFILCGDVPLLSHDTLQKVYSEHTANNACCTVLTAFLDDAGKYGRIIRNASSQMTGIVEFKDATPEQLSIQEWNTGIYCFKARELFEALMQVSNQNQQQEYYLTDVISILSKQGKKISTVVLENLTEVAGVNSQEQLAELEDLFYANIRRRWLNNGVVIHNPATVTIGDDVVLEKDVEIGQNCVLSGKTLIQIGTYIGPNSFIEDSNICDACILEGYNILINAHIPEGHILGYGEQVIEESSYE
jgi:bifunctional UDP-N-acetylglucosamine pyrophosphorylase / glucosamine-1-phosphate N-acetyltransferase